MGADFGAGVAGDFQSVGFDEVGDFEELGNAADFEVDDDVVEGAAVRPLRDVLR